MAKHAANLLALSDIPDLDLASAETNADVGAVGGPLDAADIGIGRSLEEAADTTLIGRPHIDIALKANGNLIARAPVKEVEVVIIDQARGIQYTIRGSSNASAKLSRADTRWL
jgi:hypothetical protein